MITASLPQKRHKITATLDPAIITQAKLNLYELAVKNGFIGSFNEFLASLQLNTELLLTKQDW